jgi:integrase/recombinase XerC
MNWLTDFQSHLESQGRSRHTIEAYLSDLEQYANWFEVLNKVPLEPGLLNAPDLREYRAHVIAQGVSPATWNRKRASLKVFSDWCQAQGWVAGDAMQGVKRAPIQKLPPYWLSAEDFRRFRRQLEIDVNQARTATWQRLAVRNRAVAALIMYCGLRPGEVVNLSASNLLLKERSGAVRVRAGKGGKFAELPVGAEARQALSTWMDLRGAAEGPLFTGKGSVGITTRQVERALKQVAERAGLDEFHPHRLRHTFVRRLLVERHEPEHRVQDLARHASFRTTKRYAQDGWDDLAAAVEQL